MSQVSRPSDDVFNSGWTPATGYFRPIKEEFQDDASYVESSADPQGDTFEVRLANLAWPKPDPQNPHALRVRFKETMSAGTKVTCSLVQGTRVIAQEQFIAGASFQTETIVLTAAQIASITDYEDLRLRVTAGTVSSACCGSTAAPPVLFASFPDAAQGCTCLLGQFIPIFYNASTGRWRGSGAVCGTTITVEMYCILSPLSFWATVSCPAGAGPPEPGTSTSCSPFRSVFPYPFPSICCAAQPGNSAMLVITD